MIKVSNVLENFKSKNKQLEDILAQSSPTINNDGDFKNALLDKLEIEEDIKNYNGDISQSKVDDVIEEPKEIEVINKKTTYTKLQTLSTATNKLYIGQTRIKNFGKRKEVVEYVKEKTGEVVKTDIINKGRPRQIIYGNKLKRKEEN